MYYKDVLKDTYIEKYKKEQESMYSAMNELSFSLVFLRCQYNCFTSMDSNNLSAEVRLVEKMIYYDIFKHAVLKMYRYIFDTGSDTLTLEKFRNNISMNLKPDKKDWFFNSIKSAGWSDKKNQNLLEQVKLSIYDTRTNYLAHNIPKENQYIDIYLEKLELVHELALELFLLLCFMPLDYYEESFSKNIGADVMEEKQALKEFCEKRIALYNVYDGQAGCSKYTKLVCNCQKA